MIDLHYYFYFMTIYLYILKLEGGTYYCGITKDLERRLKEHNGGKSKSTRRNLPVQIIFTDTFDSYFEAREREKKIKLQGVGRYYRKNVLFTWLLIFVGMHTHKSSPKGSPGLRVVHLSAYKNNRVTGSERIQTANSQQPNWREHKENWYGQFNIM